jgi:hypothetical protein
VSHPGANLGVTVEDAAVRPSPALQPGKCAVLAAVRSATLIGVDGQPVTVEVHVSSGLPAYQVVGLPDAAVRESRERVRAAVLSSGLECPNDASPSTFVELIRVARER